MSLQIQTLPPAAEGLVPFRWRERRRSDMALVVAEEEQLDSEILDGLVRRDPAVLGVAYDRYSRPLYSLAYKMLRNDRECEEVVQDTFVSLWKKGNTVDLSRGKLFSWLAAVLRNRCIDRVRAQGRRIPGPPGVEAGPAREVATAETAADLVYGRERAARVREAMGRLPEKQSEMIELAFFGGLTHSEIAERVGESLGTVKSRIRYGLAKLKAALAGEEVADG